jgi:hypothetical protein
MCQASVELRCMVAQAQSAAYVTVGMSLLQQPPAYPRKGPVDVTGLLAWSSREKWDEILQHFELESVCLGSLIGLLHLKWVSLFPLESGFFNFPFAPAFVIAITRSLIRPLLQWYRIRYPHHQIQ